MFSEIWSIKKTVQISDGIGYSNPDFWKCQIEKVFTSFFAKFLYVFDNFSKQSTYRVAVRLGKVMMKFQIPCSTSLKSKSSYYSLEYSKYPKIWSHICHYFKHTSRNWVQVCIFEILQQIPTFIISFLTCVFLKNWNVNSPFSHIHF